MAHPDREAIAARFREIQLAICNALEAADGKARFETDDWERPGGGGGHTRIIRNGNVLEKGGVNFSAVHGALPEILKKEMKLAANEFFATGVSIVIHPVHPLVPIIHMNIRYFEMDNGECWFGGGIDLTPAYVFEDQGKLFHQAMKDVCDRFNPAYYPKFKTWADDYFYIRHRKETRGIGGIFFDHLRPSDEPGNGKRDIFDFVVAVGETFAPTYTQLIALNKDKEWTPDHKQWQLVRRGRYVEFNLVYDRGTKFGLETDGRIESILMSLPEHASWLYNHQPVEGSHEAQSQSFFKKGIEWV